MHRHMHVLMLAVVAGITACTQPGTPPPPPTLVERGEMLFFNETFEGNGRTCGTCHRAEDNFGLTPEFIATLPPDDPLFVSDNNPALANNFENTRLMRAFGLILENQDGFADLAGNFNMRGVPHTLAMRNSIASAAGPRTGWSGDGAPGDGSLRAFATGAVIQHFPRTLERVAGRDFRLPTAEELDALEAFQLSLGRQQDLSLPLPLRDPGARHGQVIFMDRTSGKCNACHFNAGANADPELFGPQALNMNFNTGVEALPDRPARLLDPDLPGDDGFGVPGNGEFNVPPVVEAADTAPFFHDNSVATLEGAVAFYNGDAFNSSPAGLLVRGATGSGINLEVTQVEAVTRFLRVINALENLRAADALVRAAGAASTRERRGTLFSRASFELEDALGVLQDGGLHSNTHAGLARAQTLARKAADRALYAKGAQEDILALTSAARAELTTGGAP